MKPGSITTRRWNDPPVAGEGRRLLVCRYRPRGVRKEDETWDEWCKDLGPSAELLAAVHGKAGPPISFAELRRRYVKEMRAQKSRIANLARRLAGGERLTLLCSSACVDPARCHRTVLKGLIEAAG